MQGWEHTKPPPGLARASWVQPPVSVRTKWWQATVPCLWGQAQGLALSSHSSLWKSLAVSNTSVAEKVLCLHLVLRFFPSAEAGIVRLPTVRGIACNFLVCLYTTQTYFTVNVMYLFRRVKSHLSDWHRYDLYIKSLISHGKIKYRKTHVPYGWWTTD